MAYSKQNFQNGQILNAANLEAMENGIIAGQGAHNLLDNSDFRNPVNQRGKTSYSGGEYAIDRWKNQIGTNMAIMDGFIRITGDWDTRQYLREKLIGTYTFAVYAKVNVAGGYTQTIEVFENDSPIASSMCTGVGEWKIYTCTATFTGTNNITNPMVIINNRAGSISDASMDVKWAALYEGSYTADTLPPYVPKGKHVEMLNCNVPLAPHNLLDNSDFSSPIAQAGLNGMHGSMKYVCDRWISWDANATFGNGYITPGSPIDQHVSKTVVDINKTYTAAICFSDGTIKAESGKFSNGFGSYALGIYCMEQSDSSDYVTVRLNTGNNIRWVALYEGSYTADTLPAYQPKGYAAELAACQWHFERLGGTSSQILGNAVFAKAGAKSVIISIKYSPKRLSNPTLSFSNPSEYRILVKDAVNASTISAYSITSIDDIITETPFAYFRVNLANALTADAWLVLQRADGATGAYIDVNADL